MGIYVLFGIIALFALKRDAESKSAKSPASPPATPAKQTPSPNAPKPPSPYGAQQQQQGCLYPAAYETASWPDDASSYQTWIEWADKNVAELGPNHPATPLFAKVASCLRAGRSDCVVPMAMATEYDWRNLWTAEDIEDLAREMEGYSDPEPEIAACLRDKSKW